MVEARLTVSLLLLAACSGHPAGRPIPEGVQLVRPSVAFEILRDSPDLFILDLRTVEEFDGPLGHLDGAVNIPLALLEERIAELRPVRDESFLVYCREGACGLEGVRILHRHGFEALFLLEGGLEAWVKGGFRYSRRASEEVPD